MGGWKRFGAALAAAMLLSACRGPSGALEGVESRSDDAAVPAATGQTGQKALIEEAQTLRPSGYPPGEEVEEVFLGEMKFSIPKDWFYTNPGGDSVFVYLDSGDERPLACVAMQDGPESGQAISQEAISQEDGESLLNRYGLEEWSGGQVHLDGWESAEESEGRLLYAFSGEGPDGRLDGRMERVLVEGKPFLIFLFGWDGEDAVGAYGPVADAIRRTLQPSGLSCLDTGLCG